MIETDFFISKFNVTAIAIGVLNLIVIISVGVAVLRYKMKKYEKTTYYEITRKSYDVVMLSGLYGKKKERYKESYNEWVGYYGEYFAYMALRKFEKEPIGGKFLFNVYVPRPSGSTSEIDVLLICSKGLFVIESKNISGKITIGKGGDLLNNGKAMDPPPIKQNQGHINHLRNFITREIPGVNEKTPIWSIIVLSKRCKLQKGIEISDHVKVVRRPDIRSTLDKIYNEAKDTPLTGGEMQAIYKNLLPHSGHNVDNETKQRHNNQ